MIIKTYFRLKFVLGEKLGIKVSIPIPTIVIVEEYFNWRHKKSFFHSKNEQNVLKVIIQSIAFATLQPQLEAIQPYRRLLSRNSHYRFSFSRENLNFLHFFLSLCIEAKLNYFSKSLSLFCAILVADEGGAQNSTAKRKSDWKNYHKSFPRSPFLMSPFRASKGKLLPLIFMIRHRKN